MKRYGGDLETDSHQNQNQPGKKFIQNYVQNIVAKAVKLLNVHQQVQVFLVP